MKNHADLINYLIKENDLESYLEIGVFNPDHNFNKIQCNTKVSVDPDPNAKAMVCQTSDLFFEGLDDGKTVMGINNFDIIFIDGLHHADQVKKDFENSLRYLSKLGFIVMHDCNPLSEKITHVPRDNREWCGDVYKFASRLETYPGIRFLTVDFDYGCTVVIRDIFNVFGRDNRLGIKSWKDITWQYFCTHKGELINPISVDDFLKIKFYGKDKKENPHKFV
jgi:hypothetical protein